MGDEYQLRKDIDTLKSIVNGIDIPDYPSATQLNGNLSRLDSDLTVLDNDLTEFAGTLVSLRSNLITFNQELIDFDEDNTNLASDLSKLKDNLHRFITATNTLASDLSDLESSLEGLDMDLFDEQTGLDARLTALATVVGDANSGLVKGLNDLDTSLTGLDTDVDGLGSAVTALQTAVGDANSGLVKGLNDLDSSTTQFYNDVFGTNGLSSRLSATETSLGTTNTDLSKLVYSLNALSGYLTTFEGTLSEFEDELEDNPNIDMQRLNSNIVALFGAIGTVKSDVSTAQTDITQAQSDISDTQDSFDTVKTDLYGSKTVNGQTVPREPSDTASSTSLKGNLNTAKSNISDVQGTLYGSGSTNSPSNPSSDSVIGKANAIKTDLYGTGTSSNPQTGSVKANITNVKDVQIPAVTDVVYGSKSGGTASSPTSTSTLGKVNAVKTDLYGTGTASSPQTGSVKANINKVKNEDIPAVQDILYGDGTEANPADGSLLGDVYDVETGLDKAHEHVGNLQTIMYKGDGGTGTINNPASGSLMRDVNTAIDQIGDPSDTTTGTIFGDIHVVQGDISDVQGDIGDVDDFRGSDISSSLATAQKNIDKFFMPSTHLLYVALCYAASDRDKALTECANMGITVTHTYDGSNFYKKSGNSWSTYTLSNLDKPIGIETSYMTSTPTALPTATINCLYVPESNKYLIPVHPSAGVSFYTWGEAKTAPDFLEQTLLFDAIEDNFSLTTHTHSNYLTSSNISGKEDSSNKTQSISNSSTTSQYPSAKAVYDELMNSNSTTKNGHTHGSITSAGKIGSTANLPLITGTGGSVTTGSFATSATDTNATHFVSCSDSRLSDARTPKSHTHAQSEITNLTTALNGKQATIPSLTQKSTQSMYGLTVATFSDGLNVFLKITGDLNGNSSIPTGTQITVKDTGNTNRNIVIGGGSLELGTLSNTTYAPPVNMYSPLLESTNETKIKITNAGKVILVNRSTSNTFKCDCGFYYPLSSRMP